MALFGLSDITFNKGGSPRRNGPLGPLVSSQFEKNLLRYPLDIGNYDKGHYLVIYVREQKSTSFNRTLAGEEKSQTSVAQKSTVSTPISAGQSFANDIKGKISSGLDQINSSVGGNSGVIGDITSSINKGLGQITGSINNLFGQKNISFTGNSQASQTIIDDSIKSITDKSFIRTTKLTTDSIALYMPDTLQYTYSQSYDQLSLGGEIAGQVAAAAQAAADEYKEGGAADAAASVGKAAALNIGKGISAGLGKLLGSGQSAQAGFTAVTGLVQNPMLEMIYKSPNFRTFQFDFLFYPRDEREAFEAQRIIERLRFHQAPEISGAGAGFLVPPSEFDLKFYYGGRENPNIPPITTCILTTIDVNYAPNGFSAYEVPGENTPALGRTGMPTAIQLTLQFQETTYLTKSDFTSSNEFDQKSSLQRAESRDPINTP